jgi:DNA helicase-2/ATP-dependent DNA helicase PcrA
VSFAILDALDDQQRAVAEALEGPVAVRAGAGTGKTRAITHRIAYACVTGAHDPRQSLALTFTNRAAGEMRARLSSLGVEGVQVRTFHAAALRQLRYFWPRVVQGGLPRIAPKTDPLFDQAAQRAQLRLGSDLLRQGRETIEALRMKRQSPNSWDPEVIKTVDCDIDEADLLKLWRAYEQVKVDAGVMDFTDVLEVTFGMFSVHPELLAQVHRTYSWFTVDEYQDVSPLQWDLLTAWRGRHQSICVVGDANQTIYGFAGATPNYLLEFAHEFATGTTLELTHCYRSTPQIVDRANQLMARASTFMPLTSTREAGPEPTVTVYASDGAEAAGVAAAIAERLAQGVDPRGIAILFRTNAQASLMELAFADAGIATVLRGGDRFFERPEVKEAMLRMRAGTQQGDVPHSVKVILGEMGWSETTPDSRQRARWESLATIVAMSRDHEWPDLASFAEHLFMRARVEHIPVPFGVTLSTLHAAKGLEWSEVFIIGCSEGLLPLDSPNVDIDEERRLAYVGITRASDALHISWARSRRPDGPGERICSRFFSGSDTWITKAATPRAQVLAHVRQQAPPASCRLCGRGLTTASERTVMRCFSCPSDLDAELLANLITWRSGAAQKRSLPEYQVLTDQAAAAIAELRPRTAEDILVIPGTRWLGDGLVEVLGIISEAGYPLIKD